MNKRFIQMVLASVFPLMMAEASAGKRVSVCEKAFEETDQGQATGIVRFNFSDGSEQILDTNTLAPDIQMRLRVHGAMQKIGDSYAGVKGNVAEAKKNVEDVISQLTSGAWKGERGDAGPRLGELAEAIAEIKGAPLEAVKAAVEKAAKESPEQVKAWRTNAKVKATIAAIRARNAQKELEQAGEQSLDINV